MNGLFDDARTTEGHARRALRSGAVSIVARAINAVVQIGSVLFLARLLSPEDYGIVGMVTAITGFAPLLVDLGTRDAIVRRRRIFEGEINALFWITMAIGCGCALITAASAPLIARFYGDPRLTPITIICSLTFVTHAMQCQHYALLRRRMVFQELAVVEVGTNLMGAAIAVALAFAGFGYWALVVRGLASSFLLSLGVWGLARWLPARPAFTPAVTDMVKFGLNLTGYTMTDFLGRSVDRVAIGYRIGPVGLGYYQNAMYVYENIIDMLATPLHNVAVSSLSKLRGDMGELRRLWAKALTTLTFFAMPAFGVLSITSGDIIVLLLGTKWSSSGALLGILALRGIPHSVERTLGWLHVTAGRTDRWMRWGAFAAATQMIALAIGLPFGPEGVVTAFVITTFVLFVPAIAYAGHPLDIHASDVLQVVWRQMTGALAAAGVGLWMRDELLGDLSIVARMVVLTFSYLLLYLTIVAGVFGVRTPIASLFLLGGDLLARREGRFAADADQSRQRPVPSAS